MTSLPDQLRTTLGRVFAIERELEGGGMARVFVAHEATLDRRIVVKTLSPESAGVVNTERFRREIRLAASLQQANIVPVHSAGEMDGVPYYTMPFVDGESLRQHLTSNGALPLREAVNILKDVARALAFAHERGVVHRDIKPENVLLSGHTAVVTDFGIAKALEASRTLDGTPTLTQLGATLGTPAYMSPEQASGDPNVDHRADIYALGIVAYELLTGRSPFAGRPLQATLSAHVLEQPSDLRGARPEISRELGQLVMQCLAKDPAARPQSSRELLDRLEQPALFDDRDSPHARSAPPAQTKPTPMVAVLPFANLSASADDEYFSDGITEDIIAHLAQIASLRVISRTSAMHYKNSPKRIGEIAAELRATHVVEGGVRRAGNRLRIVADLIDAATDAHLWAQTFDRDLTDVFAIQTEVAERITNALRGRLIPDEQQRMSRKPTTDPEAYNLFLLARYNWNLGTPDAHATAESLCEQAIAKDPSFALAWAGVAIANVWKMAGAFGVRSHDVVPKTLRYARTALDLDPAIGEAHALLGQIATMYHFDWDAAAHHHERALALTPNSALAWLCHGFHLLARGQMTEAVAAGDRALELDPASDIVHVWKGFILWNARRFDEALAGLDPAEKQFGRNVSMMRGIALIWAGRPDEAVECFYRGYQQVPISWFLTHIPMGLAAAGRTDEAYAVLRAVHEKEATEYVWPQYTAIAYAYLGEMDRAFEYLRRAYEDRAGWWCMPHSPTFDPFRADPRFAALASRIGAIPPTDGK